MPEKLPTTPDGIVCKVCGQDKPAYHYFKHSGVYSQDFFTTQAGYTSGVCFGCAGDYRCVVCHQIKPASDYRVQGRVCAACKTAQKTAMLAQKNGLQRSQVTEAIDGWKTPEMVENE